MICPACGEEGLKKNQEICNSCAMDLEDGLNEVSEQIERQAGMRYCNCEDYPCCGCN